MYTVVSLVVDLAGEPDTIDFTSPCVRLDPLLLWTILAHWRALPRRALTRGWWAMDPIRVAGCCRRRAVLRPRRDIMTSIVLSYSSPCFFPFVLAELQLGEPVPPRLHVLLGGFLRRGWLQRQIRVGVAGPRGHFALEPAQTRAVQEEDPGRVRAGSGGESGAPDRRWGHVVGETLLYHSGRYQALQGHAL